MSCKVVKNDNKYVIVENDKVIVNSYKNQSEANKVCRGLNLGKGFNGDTPIFFGNMLTTIT